MNFSPYCDPRRACDRSQKWLRPRSGRASLDATAGELLAREGGEGASAGDDDAGGRREAPFVARSQLGPQKAASLGSPASVPALATPAAAFPRPSAAAFGGQSRPQNRPPAISHLVGNEARAAPFPVNFT